MATVTDVVVVGSGPLGVTVARRLAERGRTVLVFEQGPAISDPPGSHLRNAARFRTEPDSYLGEAFQHLAFFDEAVPRDRLPGAAVTKARGGQGVLWTNYCPRSDAPWPALTTAEWEEYYGIAETYLGVEADAVESSIRHQRIRKRLNQHLASSLREASALPFATRFDSENRLYYMAPYDILTGSTDVPRQVKISNATVETLIGSGSKISGVTVGGETIEAKAVVVAAGAIGTPQLLHRSGIRPKALARWLSYHPILISQLVLDEDLCAAPGIADRPPRLQVRPTETAAWYPLVLHDVSPFTPTEPDEAIDPNRIAEMQVICPIDVEERKGIRFDELSQPTFDVPLSSEDESRLANALTDSNHLAKVLGRYRHGCRPIWVPFGFAHMTGTTRMSAADDGTGVADYDGRVWGFDNLYLATNGLIPTRMAVNPTLTGVALSLCIADRLFKA